MTVRGWLRFGGSEREGRNVRAIVLLAATALIGLPMTAAAQDFAAGEQSFKKCAACHAIGPAAVNKLGPVLNGLDGRKAGTYPGYSYSEANKASGITWNEATFKAYIKHPSARIPGTKMPFAGIPHDKEIAALWIYIRQFDAQGTKRADLK
jgi:cytochrome c